MSNNTPKTVTVVTEQDVPSWTAGEGEPVALASIKHQLLNLPPHFKAEQLAGSAFDIVSLKPFKGSYEGQDHAYFAMCRAYVGIPSNEIPEGQLFTTVFGGQILTDTLDAVVEKGLTTALRVSLRFVRQGRYGGYYTFE